MAAEKGTCPVEDFIAEQGATFVSKSMIYYHTRDPRLLSDFLCYKNPCLSFPLDPVLHHDNQRLVVQICNSIISTEVYCQQKYRTFISC